MCGLSNGMQVSLRAAFALLVVIPVVVATGWAAGLTAEGPSAVFHSKKETEITIPGELEAADAVWVGHRLVRNYTSDVIEKVVPEGTRLKKGDFLLQLDTKTWERDKQDAEEKVKEAELNAAAAESRLATARGELDAARDKLSPRLEPYRLAIQRLKDLPDPVELSAAESELERHRAVLADAEERCSELEALAQIQAVSQQPLIDVRFARKIAASDVVRAEAQLQKVRAGADANEIAIAEAELEVARLDAELALSELTGKVAQAELELAQARTRLGRARGDLNYWREQIPKGTRHAPADGIVIYEKAYVGGGQVEKIGAGTRVSWGRRIAAIIGGHAFRFRGVASEALLGRIRVGQRAQVHLAALPEVVLRGRVKGFDTARGREAQSAGTIADLERLRPGEFAVLIEVEEVPDGLMPGLSGFVVVEASEEPGPVDAAFPKANAPGSRMRDQAGPDGLAAGQAEGAGLPRFAGYVDTAEKTAVYSASRVGGEVTYLAPQYKWLDEGDVVFETSGDSAYVNLERVKDGPVLAGTELGAVNVGAQVEARRWESEVEKAGLRLRIAQLRLEQLLSQPDQFTIRMAQAEVRTAELQRERAQQVFEEARAAGIDSQAELEDKELEARLAALRLEEARARLALAERGASEDDVRRAEINVEKARESLSYAQAMAKQMEEVKTKEIGRAQAEVRNAEENLQFWRERVEARVTRAPVAGNIIYHPWVSGIGGQIGLGDSVIQAPVYIGELADLSRLKFCAVVEDPYIAQVKVGARASVELLAFPSRSFTGEVVSLMPLVMDRELVLSPESDPPRLSGVHATRADILLELPKGEDLRILPGMTGTAYLLPLDQQRADARRARG